MKLLNIHNLSILLLLLLFLIINIFNLFEYNFDIEKYIYEFSSDSPPIDVHDTFSNGWTSKRSIDVFGFNFYLFFFQLIYFFLTCAIGNIFIKKIHLSEVKILKNFEHFLIFISSFFLGYFLIIAFFRIASFIFSIETTFIFFIICLIICLIWYLKNFKNNQIFLGKLNFNYLIVFFLLLILFHVFHVQPAKLHYVYGDALRFQIEFIENLKFLNIYSKQELPVFGTHYGELFYNFFPIMIFKDKASIYQVYLTFICLFKLSAFSFFFILTKIFTKKLLYSLLITLFIFFSDFNLDIFFFKIFFDSGNPISHSISSDRIISYIIPFMIFIFTKKINNHGIKNEFYKLYFFLIGIGISSINLTASFFIFSFYFFIFLSKKVYLISRKIKFILNLKYLNFLVIFIFPIIILMNYLMMFNFNIRLVFFIFFLFLLLFLFLDFNNKINQANPRIFEFLDIKNFMLIILGVTFGFFFTGNIIFGGFDYLFGYRKLLNLMTFTLFEPYSIETIIRPVGGKLQGFYFDYSSLRENSLHPYFVLEHDIKRILSFFGLLVVLNISLFFNTSNFNGKYKLSEFINLVKYILTFGFLFGVFVHVNFDFAVQDHLKTRFVDAFMFPLLLIGLIEVFNHSSRKYRLLLSLILSTLLISTFSFKFPWYLNLGINLDYLIKTLSL